MRHPPAEPRVIACQRTFRTGVQTLTYAPVTGRWFMEIRNRSYRSIQEVPEASIPRWKRYFYAV